MHHRPQLGPPVKASSAPRHILLVSAECDSEADIVTTLDEVQKASGGSCPCEILFFCLKEADTDLDTLVTLDLFVVCLSPSVSTCPCARNSEHEGQRPIRSRTQPYGLDRLDPTETAVISNSNCNSEIVGLFAAHALQCSSRRVATILTSQDVGGGTSQSCNTDPSEGRVIRSEVRHSHANSASLNSDLRRLLNPTCIRLRVGFTQAGQSSRSRNQVHCMTVHSHFIACAHSGTNTIREVSRLLHNLLSLPIHG